MHVRGCVIDVQSVGKGDTQGGKAVLESVGDDDLVYRLELLGFRDWTQKVLGLSPGQHYDFFTLAVAQGNDNYGFGRYVAGSSHKQVAVDLGGSTASRPVAQRSFTQLSERPSGSAGALSTARAIYVAGSTLMSFIPVNGTRDFDNAEVWELPWVTVTDITRGSKEEWHYPGCSVCLKSQCTVHSGQSRPCYAVELHFMDHTTVLEAKMFTSTADDLFESAGIAPGAMEPAQQDAVLDKLRTMNFSIRLAITKEDAYLNRAARNHLQVVRIRRQPEDWTGTVKPLLTLPIGEARMGLPAMSPEELSVDAADQIKSPSGQIIDLVILVRIGKEKPRNDRQEDEAGLRVVVAAHDESGLSQASFLLSWVVSLDDMVSLCVDLQADKILRVVARPCVGRGAIQYWQVLQHSAEVAVAAWRERLQWQRAAWEGTDGKKKQSVSALTNQTPNSKCQRVREHLESPSGHLIWINPRTDVRIY